MKADWKSALATGLDTAGRLYRGAVAVLGVALMTIIVVTMGVQVFCRYVLNDSLIWAEELSSYMLVIMSFLLLGAAFENGELMRLGILTDRLRPRWAAALRLPVLLAMAAFLVYLSWYGYKFALLNRTSTIPALDFIVSAVTGVNRTLVVSRYWLYLFIPAGFLILAMHCILDLARSVGFLAGVVSAPPSDPDSSAIAPREVE